jgi:hypothetical protein
VTPQLPQLGLLITSMQTPWQIFFGAGQTVPVPVLAVALAAFMAVEVNEPLDAPPWPLPLEVDPLALLEVNPPLPFEVDPLATPPPLVVDPVAVDPLAMLDVDALATPVLVALVDAPPPPTPGAWSSFTSSMPRIDPTLPPRRRAMLSPPRPRLRAPNAMLA